MAFGDSQSRHTAARGSWDPGPSRISQRASGSQPLQPVTESTPWHESMGVLLTLGDKVHLSLLKLCHGSFETAMGLFIGLGDFNLYLKSLPVTAHNVFCIVCKTHTHTIFTSLPFLRASLSSERLGQSS